MSVIFNREAQDYIENTFERELKELGYSVRFTGKEVVGPDPDDYEKRMSVKIDGETIEFVARASSSQLSTKEYPVDREDELGALVFAYRVMFKYGDGVRIYLSKRSGQTMISMSLTFDTPQAQTDVDDFIKSGCLKYYIDEFKLILDSFKRHYKNLKTLDLSYIDPFDRNIVFF